MPRISWEEGSGTSPNDHHPVTKNSTGRAFDTKDYDNGGDNIIINGSKALNFKSTRRAEWEEDSLGWI